jgi:hypothetical protein
MRSYLSTTKKQGHSMMDSIKSVFAGTVVMPCPSLLEPAHALAQQ